MNYLVGRVRIVVKQSHYEENDPNGDRVCGCFGCCHRLFHSAINNEPDLANESGNTSTSQSFAFGAMT